MFLDHWRSVRKGNVIRPVIGVGTGLGLLRLAGEVLELPGLRAASLLDPSPLARARWTGEIGAFSRVAPST